MKPSYIKINGHQMQPSFTANFNSHGEFSLIPCTYDVLHT